MTISEIIWPADRIEHIARHGATPAEVEEVCFGTPRVQRAKAEGDNPVYYVQGQTIDGRYLFCVIIRFSDGKGYPVTARDMTLNEKRSFSQMEEAMKKPKLPKSDSIQELAAFWDSHDATEFEADLVEMSEPVFTQTTAIRVPLESNDAKVVAQLAKARGVTREELVGEWIRQKVARSAAGKVKH